MRRTVEKEKEIRKKNISEILRRSEIMGALRFARSDGLKIRETRWKELKLWAGTK